MKDIRIFVASSKELVAERNQLSYLVLAMEDEFEKRGLRVRLSKWEYVDPTMTEARTEDRYLEEMLDCDGALILFRSVLGKYTEEEREKALAAEKDGLSRLKAHRILFKEGGGIVPCEALAAWRASLAVEDYGTFSDFEGLKAEFLALVDRLATCQLEDVSDGIGFREITAFLAADERLEEERNAFADIVLNLNDLLARRRMRVRLRFYDPLQEKDIVAASEMGLVLYQTSFRAFGREEMRSAYDQMKSGANPKRLYVFFRDAADGLSPSPEFEAFHDEFVEKLGHFVCQFSGVDTLRLSFLLSLERYAGETVEIYSTVETPTTSNFVGREDELRKLHGLFAGDGRSFPCGRVPIVTGAGGQGKSELVRQYVSQFRVEYPGGVFQVNMEHARTWDDVFVGLLNVSSNNGVAVRDYLALQDLADKQGNPRPPTAAEVRDAVLRKARDAGPMLLFLDNVEDCQSLFGKEAGVAKTFPAGFSERVHVNVVVTARVCDASLRPTDWAVEMPLGELAPTDALELLLKNQTAPSDEERESAARVAKLLGYRALYLQRVPALLGDLYADVICDTYVDLEEELKHNLLETVATETDESHLPGVLWRMTRERLEKLPLGPQCIKLAQMASFFSPEGFSSQILQHLWDDVATRDAPNLKRHFDRALTILERFHVFQSLDPVRMHRLDRAAIRNDACESDPSVVDTIGDSLRSLDWFGGDGWIDLIVETPEFATKCRWEVFSSSQWVKLLETIPDNANECIWEKLDGYSWRKLLLTQPQYADHCMWEKLDGYDWCELLQQQPQFADHCLWMKLDGWQLTDVLIVQPQLAEHCPWEKLDGGNWVTLLRKYPQFADHYPSWEKRVTEGGNWGLLLAAQPHFADRCAWDRLDGSMWVDLLRRHPQFADHCSWEKLDGYDWCHLLCRQPRFAGVCQWELLDGTAWGRLLGECPQFSKYCAWEKLDGQGWRELLIDQPQFADHCEWEKLEGEDWRQLLIKFPQFQVHCRWETLSAQNWRELIDVSIEFGERCAWEKFDGQNWCWLLQDHPQFADRCAWEKLSGEHWRWLLAEQPQFAERCAWERLDGEDWKGLILDKPEFAKYCAWEKLDGYDWCELLRSQPQFSDHCTWKVLNNDNWDMLLHLQPQFSKFRKESLA